MRISQNDVLKIKNIFKTYIATDHSLYLIGSRADDSLRGGDIDLLCLIDARNLDEIEKNRFSLLAEIKLAIGDQKIDVTFKPKSAIDTDSFVVEVLPSAVLL